jgi:hypothetical protein
MGQRGFCTQREPRDKWNFLRAAAAPRDGGTE